MTRSSNRGGYLAGFAGSRAARPSPRLGPGGSGRGRQFKPKIAGDRGVSGWLGEGDGVVVLGQPGPQGEGGPIEGEAERLARERVPCGGGERAAS